MKEYPKVPRYDHPVVENTWFDENTHILEKYDGSNFRFALYDEYYNQYDTRDDAKEGEYILGSSSVDRSESKVDKFQKTLEFDKRLNFIKNNVNKDKLKQLHKEYESPLIIFAENMIRHTLEYNWDNIPPLIVFDIYVPSLDDSMEKFNDPYREKFDGFLPWSEVCRITDEVLDMRTARYIDTGVKYSNLDTDMIGKSEFSENRAEGYVIRDDNSYRRIKIRTPEFLEMNKKIWGSNVNDSSPESKKIAYTFATNTRIKKKTKEALDEDGLEMNEDTLYNITDKVVDDIWEEEWMSFCNKTFVPIDIYKYVAERVQGTLIRPNMFGFPEVTENVAKNWDINVKNTFSVKNPDDPLGYIKSDITDQYMENVVEQILRSEDKEFGNWIIEPLTRRIKSYLWYTKRDNIKYIGVLIDGSQLNESLYDITVPFVKKMY